MSIDRPNSSKDRSSDQAVPIVNNTVHTTSDTPSSSTSTFRDTTSPTNIRVENEMSKDNTSGGNLGVEAKNFGIDEEVGMKKPIEAEIATESGIASQIKGESRPPSFSSIELNPIPLNSNSNDEKNLSNRDEKQLPQSQDTQVAERTVEMIDGRPKDIYDRFTKSQKSRILAIVSYSAIIAPMTSSIFLPSIPQMSEQLNTDAEVINYTVAVFILVIGIAPVFWSPYAGFYGRRPIYLASMPIMVVASIGVALSKNVGGLTGARIVQGIGSSCFLSVGAGSIGDIFRPTERSRGMAAFYMVTLLGPAVSPALAGVFTEYTPAGWRSCQYFLAGTGALSIFLVFFFLPETSHPPLPHDILKKEKNKKFIPYVCNPLTSLGLLRWPNILVACFISSCGMIDTYCVLVPLSTVFKDRYGIHNLAIAGCLYLVSGAGNIIGSKIVGPWADAIVVKYIEKRGYRRPEDRLRAAFLGIAVIMPLSNLAYGWLLQYGSGGMAPPLIMTFLNGVALMFGFAPLNTYLIDAMQTRSAEVIAVNNCIRYIFAAAASACVLPIANAIGWGITMTICAILTWVAALALYLLYKYGDKWRENANLKYGITTKQADEEKVESGQDEESAISPDQDRRTSVIDRGVDDEAHGHDEEDHEHPVDLVRGPSKHRHKHMNRHHSQGRDVVEPINDTSSSENHTRPNVNNLKRTSTSASKKNDLPNVEQVLKRTVSLSGASVHGGG